MSAVSLLQFVLSFFVIINACQCRALAENIFCTLLSSYLSSINARQCKTYPVKVSYNPLSVSLLCLNVLQMQHASLGGRNWCHGRVEVFRRATISVVNNSQISMFGKLRNENRSKPLKESTTCTLLTRKKCQVCTTSGCACSQRLLQSVIGLFVIIEGTRLHHYATIARKCTTPAVTSLTIRDQPLC